MAYRNVKVMPLHMVEKGPYTVEAPGYEAKEGETIPRRHPKAKDGLWDHPEPGINTVFDLVKRTAEKYGDEPGIASRRLVTMHKETKKVKKVVDGHLTEVDKEWQYFELSPYTTLTYAEYETLIVQVGAGLRKLGLAKPDRVHLFASTSMQWLAMSHACASQSLAIVTAYDTLGVSGVEHSLTQTHTKAMFIDPHLTKVASTALKKADDVKVLIYNNFSNVPYSEKDLDDFKKSHADLKIVSFEEVRQLGEDFPVQPVPPQADENFCIMYTSGSTGPPKGVPFTHAAVVSAVAGVYACVEESVSHDDSILAYLPLAHIFEMVLENLVIFIGGTLGYGTARTLSDASMRNSAGDMREFKPSIMVGVPQVWETVRKGVVGQVAKSSLPIRTLFWGAYNIKSFLVDNGLPGSAAFDSLVFGRVRQMTGGRLRFIMNGASGIAAGTQKFMSLVVAPMISGYGLTETCGNGALGSPLQYTPGPAMGPVPAAVEVKLVSLPDLGYSAAGSPPQGEILIRGRPVLDEYFENPDETAAAITADGWFRTGDIGQLEPNGHFAVIDRVKNLVKLQGGEYIALEKLEAIYRGASPVLNVMIYGDSEHARPIAVVCPNEKVVAEIAQGLGVGESHMHTDAKVKDAVLKELIGVAKKNGLSAMETVTGVVLTDEEWTPGNGLVTATQKVNRRGLKTRFQKEITDAFPKDS